MRFRIEARILHVGERNFLIFKRFVMQKRYCQLLKRVFDAVYVTH